MELVDVTVHYLELLAPQPRSVPAPRTGLTVPYYRSLYDAVAKDLMKIPEIVRLNYITGNYSMFIEIVCKDINQLRSVLHDELQKIKGIERTETFISLEEGFNRNVQVVAAE